MVHIGNNPPDLDEIAERLTAGDIITHCYNGKPNRILTPGGELRASITRALQRGGAPGRWSRHCQPELCGRASARLA
ncbi:dihydroorotase [Citrobacter koseri]|uniref:Dihydroorotase n=1 Tax=Citrobacter koseri TaxID=545 RepID=A0A3S4KN47_CITKO|nr:dihydroorotase [Citrobacter koseri]